MSIHEPEPVVEEIRNLCTFPLHVRIAPSVSRILRIEPGVLPEVLVPARGTARIEFAVTAPRRGEHRLGRPTLRFGSPGGLAVRQIPFGEETSLRVFPNVARLRRYEVLRRARALAALGIHRMRTPGSGGEFDHLRPYVRDDDYRRIHWKATARRGHPVTQVVRIERGQSVLIAVDASHWMGISAGDLSRLDYAVDAALFLAHVARRSEDQVGLAIFAGDVTSFLPPGAKPGQVRRILEALYDVRAVPEPPSYRNLVRYILGRRLRRSLVVVLSEPPDTESAAQMRVALARLSPRHLPLAVSLRDPALARMGLASPGDVPRLCRRLAAREVERERQTRLREEARAGLHVLDASPEDLSVSLVNRYLSLKARGSI